MFQEGDYEGALASWRESHSLRPAPVVLYNIGLALRELFRYSEAVDVLKRYVRQADSISRDRKARVERLIAFLQARIAPVTLNVSPPGAEIRIDGRVVGAAPLESPLQLSAGRRRLEIVADGFVPVRDEITVVGKRARSLSIRLPRRKEAGRLRVVSKPEKARIRIDGLDVGTAPVERRLPRGGHVIEAMLPDHQTYRASIQLADRQSLLLNTVLDETKGPEVWEQWWFWTAIGAAVAGGVVATIFLAQPDEPAPVPGSGFQSVIEVLSVP